MNSKDRRLSPGAWIPGLIACAGALALAVPTTAIAQDRGRDRGSDRQSRDSDRSSRDSGRDSGRSSRDDERRHRDDSRVRFTHSEEGRRFENGVVLRRSAVVTDHRLEPFFAHRVVSYPHYYTTRVAGSVVISPFGLYVGVFPPYIDRSAVFISRPSHIWIDVGIPIGGGGYYLARRGDDTRWRDDVDLKHSVYDLEDAFKNEDISLLAPLTDPGTKIAIFTKGHYEYSIEPNDYLDMTRDFLRSVHTVDFNAYRVHYRSSGVYQVFAKHVYKDQDGVNKTVNLCMVVERIGGRWTLTQIDTTPA